MIYLVGSQRPPVSFALRGASVLQRKKQKELVII
jgi:hypothetical protein